MRTVWRVLLLEVDMRLRTSVFGYGLLFGGVLLSLAADRASAERGKNAPKVTLTITRVRAYEFSSTELEGEFKGKKVRNVLMACDVVVDNQTGENLIVHSNFSSALDYLDLELFRDGKRVVHESYNTHLSPTSLDGKPFLLKKGTTRTEMRFPIRLPPKDWSQLQARLQGSLPGSKFKGTLESNKMNINRVVDFESSAK